MSKENLIRARNIAKRIYKREHLEVPADIEKVLKKYADVEGEDIPFKGDAICINRDNDRPLIMYDYNTIETRKRFTLAHELGHIIIPWHTGMISCNTDNLESINSGKYKDMEIEANVFSSEILMPTEWLKAKVNMYIEQGFENTIKKVAEEAKVSFLAAFYAVINILPSSCFVRIHYHEYECIRKISAEEDELFMVYAQQYSSVYESDEWLKLNMLKYEFIERENETIEFFYFGEQLEDNYVDEFSEINLDIFFEEVFESEKIKPITVIPYIMKKLESGYILKVKTNKDNKYRIIKSKDTFIKLDESDFDITSVDKGIYRSSDYQINWWKFNVEKCIKNNYIDTRDSKTILKEIVDRHYSDESDKKSVFGVVNGIIGALNGSRRLREYSKDQFYSILHQKFLGNSKVNYVVEDRDFDKFIYMKTNELYSN